MVDYENMTQEELLALQAEEYRLQKIAQELEKKRQEFYVARSEAVKLLEDEHNSKMIQLNSLWSAKENNGYDIDYVPE
jgi:hypothetical protein